MKKCLKDMLIYIGGCWLLFILIDYIAFACIGDDSCIFHLLFLVAFPISFIILYFKYWKGRYKVGKTGVTDALIKLLLWFACTIATAFLVLVWFNSDYWIAYDYYYDWDALGVLFIGVLYVFELILCPLIGLAVKGIRYLIKNYEISIETKDKK